MFKINFTMKTGIRLITFLITMIIATGCIRTSKDLNLKIRRKSIEIDNGIVKAIFTPEAKSFSLKFYSIKNGEYILVAESFLPVKPFPPEATQLFNTSINSDCRYLVTEIIDSLFIEKNEKDVIIIGMCGKKGRTSVTERVTLRPEQKYFHISVDAVIKDTPARIDYLLSTFTLNLNHAPFFVHTPGLKFDNEDSKQNRFRLRPAKDQIIGDRAFHAPAVILQEKELFFALVPDLNAINKYAVKSPDARRTLDIPRNIFSVPIEDDKYTMPTGLDLNVQTGITKKPVISFGLMDNIIAHHIRYQRVNDSSMVRTLEHGNLRYEFDLFVSADAPENRGYQQIAAHQWKQYGHEVFMNRPHLALPFEEYFRIVDSITFNPIHSRLEGTFVTSGRNTIIRDIDVPLPGYKDMGS